MLSAFFELVDEVDKLRQLGENALVGYLITVTRNNAIDMRRRQKRWEKHCFYTDDPSIFDQICADTSVEDEIIRQANAEMLYQMCISDRLYLYRLLLFLFLMLICDAPFVDRGMPYLILRSNRKSWFWGTFFTLVALALFFWLSLIHI